MRTRILFFVGFVLSLALNAFAQTDVVFQDLKESRNLYGTPMSKTEIGELLTAVTARHPGWVMLRKASGNNCPTPLGVAISCDYLIDASSGQGYDVLRDQEGDGAVQWSAGDKFTSDRFLAPVISAPPPASVPHTGTNLPSTGSDLDAVLSLIGDLQAQITATEDKVAAVYDQNERIYADLVARLNVISARPIQAAPVTIPVLPSLPMLSTSTGSGTGEKVLLAILKYGGTLVSGYLAAQGVK